MAVTDRDSSPLEDSGRGVAALVSALEVRRNATLGFGLGAAFALAVFLQFVYFADRRYPTAYWVALGFVLAVGVGLLLTVLFTLASARRVARQL